MNICQANRMNIFQQSIFSELARLKREKIAQGIEMIDLSIGSPDLAPPPVVMETLSEATKNPAMYGYSLKGTEEFHRAVKNFYSKRYSVDLNYEDEILALMGSQDGLVHLPMVLCNPGDYILVPDPGYTAYGTGAAMAGAKIFPMPLKKENHFLPDLEEIPQEIREKAKLMILNFPGNPVPAMATEDFFKKVIRFCRENHIVVLHDFAYSELYYEEKPISFLSVEGAKEVGIEMNSLSKSFNMAGCRIAYAAGNKEVLRLLGDLKSNIDYGIFFPVQAAAAKVLLDSSNFLDDLRSIYRTRRDILVKGFRRLGWNVDAPKATMFMWAEVPSGFTSKDFALELIHRANIVVTPGNAFGSWGEGFVRIALVQPEVTLRKALHNLEESGIFL
jgi:aspartate/methionine/tyrosine aminotransferase